MKGNDLVSRRESRKHVNRLSSSTIKPLEQSGISYKTFSVRRNVISPGGFRAGFSDARVARPFRLIAFVASAPLGLDRISFLFAFTRFISKGPRDTSTNLPSALVTRLASQFVPASSGQASPPCRSLQMMSSKTVGAFSFSYSLAVVAFRLR